MKVLIDTCIVIDFLQKREPFAENAFNIFIAAATEKFQGYITAKAATDIYYLMHRFTHDDSITRDKLTSLLSIVGLLDTKADDIFQAIVSSTSDFEDAVMIATASNNDIDCIVTRNIKDYAKASITVYTPEEFLENL